MAITNMTKKVMEYDLSLNKRVNSEEKKVYVWQNHVVTLDRLTKSFCNFSIDDVTN